MSVCQPFRSANKLLDRKPLLSLHGANITNVIPFFPFLSIVLKLGPVSCKFTNLP